MQSVCSDCPVSSCVSVTSYDTIDLHVSVYTSFYLFTFLIAAQKILLVKSIKASKRLQPHCAQQALAGGLGGTIVPHVAADGGSNEGKESIEEDKPDNDEDQAGEVYVWLNFSYSEMLS